MDKKGNVKLRVLIATAGLIAAVIISISVFLNPGRPGPACLMCHKMRDSYQSWRISSHKKVKCDKCHYAAPSGLNMLLSTAMGSTTKKSYTAVSLGCRKCHEKLSNVVKIESISFPHADHQEVQNCETCHLNVVHGSDIEYTFQHERKLCYDCHKHSEVNPHSGEWEKEHGDKVRESSRECQACHSSTYCKNCHGVLQDHKSEWYDGHRKAARESDTICSSCHNSTFCSSCHDGFTLHQKNWLKNHQNDPASKNQEGCSSCHTTNYCKSCHKDNKHVLHHQGNWLSNHGSEINEHTDASSGDLEQCVDCHQPDFCLSCHRGLNARIHSSNYEQMHINVKRESIPNCLRCHSQDSCDQCHNKNLPESHIEKDVWKKAHGAESIRKMDSCTLCHSQEFCAACHSKKVPDDHENPKWKNSHGAASRANASNCSLCHQEKYCNTCHRRSRPPDHYASTWKDTHSHTAVYDMSGCFACHVNSDCRKCHGEGKIHKAAGWMVNHSTSEDNFQSCEKCHSTSSCMQCHKELKLEGHTDCSTCHKNVKDFSKIDTDICNVCHNSKEGSIHEKHDSLGCDMCHKPHSWKPGINSCFDCHGDKDETHSNGMPCLDCHSFN